MSTRDERKRARRLVGAALTHWAAGAKNIHERVYASIRLADLPNGAGYVPSDDLPCARCGYQVAIDKRLIPLARRAKAIVCVRCISKETGKPWQQIMIDQLNADNTEEI